MPAESHPAVASYPKPSWDEGQLKAWPSIQRTALPLQVNSGPSEEGARECIMAYQYYLDGALPFHRFLDQGLRYAADSQAENPEAR